LRRYTGIAVAELQLHPESLANEQIKHRMDIGIEAESSEKKAKKRIRFIRWLLRKFKKIEKQRT
jgi:hypothetical protein